MFFDLDLKGNRLPPGTVCLSYDDGPGQTIGAGPGPRTAELGQFLSEEGIPAAFFVIGRHAEEHGDVLAALHEWGHLIGNHTYSHPGLVSLAQSHGDVTGELARTDALIRPYVDGRCRFFRPPYGNWREKEAPDSPVDKPTSVVAELLNAHGQFGSYVGPVNWDISNEDWNCWRNGLSPAQCAEGFLRKTESLGQGIILMHDSSDDSALRAGNQALAMTQILVSALKQRGYRFISLDAIPQIQSAARVTSQVYIRTLDGEAAFWRDPASDSIRLRPVALEPPECFGVVPLGADQIALRAENGLFVSVNEFGPARADASDTGAAECLTLEETGEGRARFRASQGGYLASLKERIHACSESRERSASFVVEPRFGRWPPR